MATQKELAAQWIAFGYRKGMASATITPPPPKAFRRVYHKARLAYRSFRVVLNGYTRPSGSPTK